MPSFCPSYRDFVLNCMTNEVLHHYYINIITERHNLLSEFLVVISSFYLT